MTKRHLCVIIAALSVACDNKGDSAIEDSGGEASCDVDVVVLDYADQASWASENADCGGESQSPVDIPSEILTPDDQASLRFNYSTTPLRIINNGHSIEYEVEPEGNTLTLGEDTYALVQFHFHSPSEHTVNGEHVPMELHLVHKDDEGNVKAVVGIFIVEGDEQPWFAGARWEELPAESGDCLEDEETLLDLEALIQTQLEGELKDVVHYAGSLTTPPCSEEVSWLVLGQYLSLSTSQIEAFTRLYSGNNREIQALNTRTLTYDEDFSK